MGLAAVTLGIFGISIWTEDRFPIEETAPGSVVAQVREVTTQPLVAVVSQQLERHIRTKLSGQWLAKQIPEDETIDRFLSPSTPFGERRMLAVRLARLGTPEAIAALLQGFEQAPPEQQALLAQLLGSTGIPEMKPRLLMLLYSNDERLVAGAMRGLAALGDQEVSTRLERFLIDEHQSIALRSTAAQVLGEIGTISARDALVSVLTADPFNELTPVVLQSLGVQPFSRVAVVFDRYLAAPETPPELRVTAVESLAFSSKEAVPFLLRTAAYHADPEVRASAAWAVSTHESPLQLGSTLAAMVAREEEPDVRRRLYEALTPQPDIPATSLMARALAEDDIDARVAAYNAVASAIGQGKAFDTAGAFDHKVVPDLVQIAGNENTLNVRLRAVFALRRANTDAAQQALATLATSSNPTVAAASRAGLFTQTNHQPPKGVIP